MSPVVFRNKKVFKPCFNFVMVHPQIAFGTLKNGQRFSNEMGKISTHKLSENNAI